MRHHRRYEADDGVHRGVARGGGLRLLDGVDQLIELGDGLVELKRVDVLANARDGLVQLAVEIGVAAIGRGGAVHQPPDTLDEAPCAFDTSPRPGTITLGGLTESMNQRTASAQYWWMIGEENGRAHV